MKQLAGFFFAAFLTTQVVSLAWWNGFHCSSRPLGYYPSCEIASAWSVWRLAPHGSQTN